MRNLKNAKLSTNPFIDAMYDVLNSVDYKNNTTVVTIDGVDYVADELYVRALQVVAAKSINSDEFNKRIQIWSNKKKKRQMMICKNTGRFERKFDCAIYSAAADINFELYKIIK